MNSTKRNVALLAACQAMLFSNNSTLITINGLVGLSLAPYSGLATLPVMRLPKRGSLSRPPRTCRMMLMTCSARCG